MSILITGGAGYIGSHMVYEAIEHGEDVVVLDNLSTGVRALVADKVRFHQGDVGDIEEVRRVIRDRSVTAVFHFAASVVVPESVASPLKYYANNMVASRNLIEACVLEGVKFFIFSSTAAVYGSPECNPIPESASTNPINPYGRSKLATEWILQDAARAHDFRYVTLRYFNVAGGDPQGRTGQSTPRATHLIKRACQVALGRRPVLEIFGTDFPTHDGTGVRDYIHVSDLVGAHMLAFGHLRDGGASLTLNCGYGLGFSVRDVISAITKTTGRKIPVVESPRRMGDAPEIIADPSLIRAAFGWRPKYDDLSKIVATSFAWEARLNSG
jgi:UDP-glucose 4-epimerase